MAGKSNGKPKTTSGTIGKAYVQILPSVEGIGAQMNSLLGGEMKGAGDKAGSLLGGALSGGLLSALTGIGGKIAELMKSAVSEVTEFISDSVNVGSAFDSQMSQIAATMGITTADIKENIGGAGETFDLLRDKAKEMGAATNFSAAQAAEGLNILAMSGYDAESSVGMIEDVLHLAAAGGMEMSTAAADISGAMKGFGDVTKDSACYADLMAKGATLANTNVTQLGEALSETAAQGKAYGQTAENTTLALLRLAEQGEVGANASTMLSAAMKDLYTPTDQAKQALDELGVAAFDSSGNYRDINEVINELNASLGKYSNEQQAAYINTIFGIQGQNAYNKMVVTSIDKQKEWTAALAGSSGEAAKQYETMTDNLAGDIDKWNSALEGFKIEISDKVMPAVRDLVQTGTDGLSRITAAFTEGGIEGAAKAFGGVFEELLGKASGILPDVLKAAVSLSEGFVKAFANSLPAVLNAVSGAVPLVSQALKDIGAALVKNAPVLFSAVGELVSQLISAGLDLLPDMIAGAAEMLSQAALALAEYVPMILQTMTHALPEVGAALTEALPVLIEAAGELLGALIEALPDLLTGFVNALPEILRGLLGALPMLIDTVNELLVKLGETLPEILPVLLPALTECIKAVVESAAAMLTNNIVPLLDTVIEVAKTLIECIIDNIGLFADCVWEVIKAVGKAIYDNAPELEEKLFALIEKLIGYLPELYDKLIEAGGDLIMKLAEGFNSSEFKNAMLEWGDSVLETFGIIWEDIKDFWGGLWDRSTDIGGDIIDGIWEGITAKWEKLKEDISEFGDTVVETFCDIFDINSPSKVMEKLIGKNLALGIETGFTSEIGSVSKLIAREAEDSISGRLTDIVPSVSAEAVAAPSRDKYTGGTVYTDSGRGASGVNITFNQTNNSPKALSRWDTYRQTKTLLRELKGAF